MNIINSSVSMKSEPTETSPLETECLFGETVDILDERLDWVYCKLNTEINTSEEKKIDEFLKFLPILSYDGFDMHMVDANEVLEVSSAGTSSTLLAKRWMHDSLIYVDNLTLAKSHRLRLKRQHDKQLVFVRHRSRLPTHRHAARISPTASTSSAIRICPILHVQQ